MSAMQTRHPASENTLAWPNPAPEAPPVINATLPVKSFIIPPATKESVFLVTLFFFLRRRCAGLPGRLDPRQVFPGGAPPGFRCPGVRVRPLRHALAHFFHPLGHHSLLTLHAFRSRIVDQALESPPEHSF